MKRYFVRSLMLIVLVLSIAGCTASEAELRATIEPQSCPTAPACPTSAAVQIPAAETTWSSILHGASVMYITFDPGEKCSVKTTPSLLHSGILYYNIKVNDQAHATYAVIFQTLDEGKTLADLQAYSKTAKSAPSWDTAFRENYVSPGSNSYYAEDFSAGQVYISCFISNQSGILRILDYGPVEIK